MNKTIKMDYEEYEGLLSRIESLEEVNKRFKETLDESNNNLICYEYRNYEIKDYKPGYYDSSHYLLVFPEIVKGKELVEEFLTEKLKKGIDRVNNTVKYSGYDGKIAEYRNKISRLEDEISSLKRKPKNKPTFWFKRLFK